MPLNGVFVGLTTLDFIYQVDAIPHPNQKVVAIATTLAAGGPATNAAVAFQHLGNQATLLSVVGHHPIHHLVTGDLENCGVAIADLMPTYAAPPPVSSIFVTTATGDRAVVSVNATQCQATSEHLSEDVLRRFDQKQIDVVLIDGHQRLVGEAIAQIAKQNKIPVIVDGGSWKPGFESVLRYTDVALCSANFFPPGCTTHNQVLDYLSILNIPLIAITQGDRPILYSVRGKTGTLSVPSIRAVDTLGAGDIFHGAWCHYALSGGSRENFSPCSVTAQQFTTTLSNAAAIASRSCQFFGTRQWMTVEGDRPEY
ncbi:MAG: PfkB family carbohydrate kinase [Cyanobacteria bacterium P01_A01_bin.37]